MRNSANLGIGGLLGDSQLGGPWSPFVQLSGFQQWRSILFALSSLSNAMFNMHSSALYVLGRTWEVTAFHLVNIALLLEQHFWCLDSVWWRLVGLRR